MEGYGSDHPEEGVLVPWSGHCIICQCCSNWVSTGKKVGLGLLSSERDLHEKVRQSRSSCIDRIPDKVVQILGEVQSNQYCCNGSVRRHLEWLRPVAPAVQSNLLATSRLGSDVVVRLGITSSSRVTQEFPNCLRGVEGSKLKSTPSASIVEMMHDSAKQEILRL